jgi:hypothetical protein
MACNTTATVSHSFILKTGIQITFQEISKHLPHKDEIKCFMNVIMHTDEKIMAGRRAYIYNTT